MDYLSSFGLLPNIFGAISSLKQKNAGLFRALQDQPKVPLYVLVDLISDSEGHNAHNGALNSQPGVDEIDGDLSVGVTVLEVLGHVTQDAQSKYASYVLKFKNSSWW